MPYGITLAWPFTKTVRWVWTWTTVCSPAWHCTPSMVCPVAALRRVASFGPVGTGIPSGPCEPAGGCTQLDDMEAGMAWSGTCGFLNWGGTPPEPPPRPA